MNIQNTRTMTYNGTTVTVGELREFLTGLSNSDTVSVRVSPKDRPCDSSSVTLEATVKAPTRASSIPISSGGMGYISDSTTLGPYDDTRSSKGKDDYFGPYGYGTTPYN